MSVPPWPRRPISSALGARDLDARRRRPRAVRSRRLGARLLVQRVGDQRGLARAGSTTTSWACASLRTTSGTSATRRSPLRGLLGNTDLHGGGTVASPPKARHSRPAGAEQPPAKLTATLASACAGDQDRRAAAGSGRRALRPRPPRLARPLGANGDRRRAAAAGCRRGRARRRRARRRRSPPLARAARGGAGSGRCDSASSACAVTHTGVWRRAARVAHGAVGRDERAQVAERAAPAAAHLVGVDAGRDQAWTANAVDWALEGAAGREREAAVAVLAAAQELTAAASRLARRGPRRQRLDRGGGRVELARRRRCR